MSGMLKGPWIEIEPHDSILAEMSWILAEEEQNHLFLVKGVEQSGKTRLMLELARKLSERESLYVGCVDGRASDLISSIYRALGEKESMESLPFMKRMELLFKQRKLTNEHVVLCIDNADHLTLDLLFDLKEMIYSDSLPILFSVVLFYSNESKDLMIRDLLEGEKRYELTPLDIAGATLFINEMQSYYGDEETIPNRDVNEIHNITYGYPGRIVKHLQGSRAAKKGGIPFIYGFFGLAALAMILFFLTPQKEKGEERKTVVTKEVEKPLGAELTVAEKIALLEVEYDPHLNLREEELKRYEENLRRLDEEILGANGRRIEVRELIKIPPPKEATPKREAAKVEAKKVQSSRTAYYLELATGASEKEVRDKIAGRSIPGSLNVSQKNGRWIAYLGPYQSEKQAKEGAEKLPASVRALAPKVIRF